MKKTKEKSEIEITTLIKFIFIIKIYNELIKY
jgi:hypothetical protein